MTTTATIPLDDVLNAFAMAKEIPDVDLLEEYTKKYPNYADALTEFAVELLLDGAILDDENVGDADESATVSPAVSRAISFFQNAVYELEKKAAAPAPMHSVAQTKNIFADMDRIRFRSITARMNANNTFMMKVRDRMLEPGSVIARPGFCQKLAEEAEAPLDLVIAHVKGAQVIAKNQVFKSDEKPALAQRETFEDAVRNSGMTAQQQSYLLGL